ncbi:VOC family protein [Nocardiopsis quinghaiensis]|uniref:VOC family protein n=1 Tax=Nocardiopsis quinghaiensis TaxID=464995 RepID=UPI0016801205
MTVTGASRLSVGPQLGVSRPAVSQHLAVLEPSGHPAVEPYGEAPVDDGIPATAFAVDDVRAEFDRPRERGARFTREPLKT